MEITIDFISIYNFLMSNVLGRILIYGSCTILGIILIGLTCAAWYKVVKYLFSKIFNLLKVDDSYNTGCEIASIFVSVMTYIVFMPFIIMGPDNVEKYIINRETTEKKIERKLDNIDSKLDSLPFIMISDDSIS